MKIAVIAASGRSGQAFVEAALSAGHYINAGIRSRNNLTPHPNLRIIQCDATNENQLKDLMNGQDAVASFIGHVKGSDKSVQTDAIEKTVKVMDNIGLKRLVSLTGTGVRFEGDKITLLDRFLNLSISIIDPSRVKDGKDHVEVLKNSDLDWTVIRVLKLQNTQTRAFKLLLRGPTKPYVNRQEVAQAFLQVLEQNSFVKQAPIIGK